MPVVNGQITLNANEIFSALSNMIISQETFADNFGKHQTLVDKARVDGGLYGDTKLYYSADVLASSEWGNDAEAQNLLALHRPSEPDVQKIVLNKFRQIALTTDNYLSKRAWGTEGAFMQFTDVMKSMMSETKKVHEGTTYNTFIGTTVSPKAKQNIDITLTGTNDGQALAEGIANLLVEMGDYSRDFNDFENLRSYAESGIKVIWNSKYVNKIKKVDLPTIFHKEGLVDKLEDDVLPARYFGDVKTEGGNGDGATIRTLVEGTFGGKHLFPGDIIPDGATYEANEAYQENANIICKVIVKYPPFMSAFEAGTSFFNPKSLTENFYLTWGYNTLEYLMNYPFITVKKA